MWNVFKRLNLGIRWQMLTIAMSDSKQKIIKKLSNIQEPLDLHICKYILYSNKDNDKYKNHWEKEIFLFLDRVQNLIFKHSNKRPSSKFFKEWLFSLDIDNFQSFNALLNFYENECGKMKPAYPKRTKKIDLNKAWIEYNKFIDLCSKDMETGDLTLNNLRKYIKPLHTSIE